MRYLIDRIRYGGAPKTPQEADSLALRQLAGRGADLSKPRHVVHFLYFPSEADARAAAEACDEGKWTTAVEPPTETIDQWCLKAEAHRTVGPDTVAAFRAWFEGVASTHGGEYDGWEAAAKP
jgi:Regulator of ribonuclease activity B